jgi:hypothetical protein
MDVDVLQIPVPKERLLAVPKEERALFFMLGYAANQIIMFQKLLIFSCNTSRPHGGGHGSRLTAISHRMVMIPKQMKPAASTK